MNKLTFYQVLSAAINDLLEHGFDSQERLTDWLKKLSQAARDSLVPEYVLVSSLRDMLGRVYSREIAKISKAQPFTLAQVRPSLRAELDRRILASANLITLNRDVSIQRSLQRFAGWATSIPMGGTEIEKRRKVKDQVKRGISGLPFEERRVITDQGHKLAASINEIVATDGGAIALMWHHVAERRPEYDARPDHVARDKKIYLLRDSWAMKAGYIRRDSAQFYDEITAVAQEPFCRCSAEYLFALRDLPAEMLTNKGKEALLEARKLAA